MPTTTDPEVNVKLHKIKGELDRRREETRLEREKEGRHHLPERRANLNVRELSAAAVFWAICEDKDCTWTAKGSGSIAVGRGRAHKRRNPDHVVKLHARIELAEIGVSGDDARYSFLRST